MEKRSCSLADGPNCFQVSNFKEIEDNEYLLEVLEKMKIEKVNISLETLYKRLNQELTKFKEKHKRSLNEVFKFKPKIMMNLLLNFESYDQTTKDHDFYMPEEKVIQFQVGFLKINFRGKLRLTQKKRNEEITSDIKSGLDTPSKTYGVVEEDLTILFDKPVYVKYMYTRQHKSEDQLDDIKSGNNIIVGYINGKERFHQSMVKNSDKWVNLFIIILIIIKIFKNRIVLNTIRKCPH